MIRNLNDLGHYGNFDENLKQKYIISDNLFRIHKIINYID